MESKKINQLATELTPSLSDLTIIGDPSTGISKKITLSQMASLFTGTVEEYANVAAFPLVGVADTIYIALDTNVLYRWNTGTNAYVELSPNIINSLVFSDANGFDGNISLVGSVATLTITTALTTGSVPFIGASGALSQDNANLFFDDTNNRLGINTNAPTTALDVFGSGIIGRINGTSTNNAFLGFSSAGTNKWSIGNVQSDHRFRIYSEANSAELVSVLQTGEFGIGIANPTTKFHIDGAASALIANLDANVSVAKSISFRSDNSNRINLEVSGTESGSNAGANFFIRRYSDAGALIDTALTILRSSGNVGIGTNTPNQALDIVRSSGATYVGTSSGSIDFLHGIDASGLPRLFTSGANAISIWTNSLERLRVTSTGNVGIGTDAPNVSGQGTDRRILTVQGTGGVWGGVEVGTNGNTSNGALIGFYGFTSPTLTGNGAAGMPAYIGTWLSGTAGSTIGSEMRFFTKGDNGGVLQRMVINNNGFVGISSTSPDVSLLIGATATLTATSSPTQMSMDNSYLNSSTQTGDKLKMYILRGGVNIGLGCGNIGDFNIWCDGLTRFYNGGFERMRINSDGVVLVNQTSISTAGAGTKMQVATDILATGNAAGFFWENRSGGVTTNSNWYGWYTTSGTIYLYNGAGNIASINASSGAYTALSDINKKKDFEDSTIGLNAILNLKPTLYRFKDEDESVEKHLGFIAQEVKPYIPQAFVETEGEDENFIGLDDRPILAALVKGMQEQQTMIEELKAEVALLKSK